MCEKPSEKAAPTDSKPGRCGFSCPLQAGWQCCSPRHVIPTALPVKRKHSTCTVADFVDAREDRLLANGIDV